MLCTPGYGELLEQVKAQLHTARVQAARAVNTELVGLYWRIGGSFWLGRGRRGGPVE